MRLRIKIVAESDPNSDGIWIERRVPGPFRKMHGCVQIFGLLDSIAPDGFKVVDYRRPYRRKASRRIRI